MRDEKYHMLICWISSDVHSTIQCDFHCAPTSTLNHAPASVVKREAPAASRAVLSFSLHYDWRREEQATVLFLSSMKIDVSHVEAKLRSQKKMKRRYKKETKDNMKMKEK